MHTPEEERIISEYQNAIDEDVRSFVDGIINGNDRINYITVAFLSNSAAEEIEELTGKSVTGNRVVLDANAVRHIIKRHGDSGKQDYSLKDINDLARMGYVIMNYDKIEFDGVTTTGYLDENGNPSPMVKISKRIDGTYYVIEAVSSSKGKKCYIVTAYISTNKKQPSNP